MKKVLLLIGVFAYTISAVSADGHDVTLSRVWLYSSGVGLFEYEGRVDGDGAFELTAGQTEMADIVRTLTVQDLDGGTVTIARYDAAETLVQRLGRYDIDLSGNPDTVSILWQLRGHTVSITSGSGERIIGRVIAVDRIDDERYSITLFGTDGFRTLPGTQIASIVPDNPELRTEIERALRILGETGNDEERSIRITFAGTGERRIRLRYIREVPVWKTSYRIAQAVDESLLQGWAHVDNTTNHDWSGVELVLVAGSPSTFFMDLYTTINRERPRIAYDSGPVVVAPRYESRSRASAPAPAMLADSFADDAEFDLGSSVVAQASADSTPIFARYRIEGTVTLNRGESAMIPIVNRSVPSERISIFDTTSSPSRVYAAVRFTNDGEALLPPGPATIFDHDTYGGDARLSTVPAGDVQLLAYAVNPSTRVVSDGDTRPEEMVQIKITNGILEIRRSQRRTTTYSIENRSSDDETVLIRHARTSGWTVESPEPEERDNDAYTFAVDVAGNETETIVVDERRLRDERIAVSNMNDTQIGFYISQRLISPGVRRALENVRQLQIRYDEARRAREALETEERTIFRDQERIRENMAGLEREGTLYRRYASTLAGQEDRLDELRGELAHATELESRAREALTEYLANLSVQ